MIPIKTPILQDKIGVFIGMNIPEHISSSVR